MATQQISTLAVLKRYFGLKSDQDNKSFLEETKKLSPEVKEELALLAAKELEVELVPVK